MEAAPPNAGNAFFIRSSVAILTFTMICKLISVGTSSDYLQAAAPIFTFLKWKEFLIVASAVEGITTATILWSNPIRRQLLAILWISSVFLTFRMTLWLTGYTGPCNCAGFVGDWIHLPRAIVETTMLTFAWYMFLGSLFCLVLQWRHRSKIALSGVLFACSLTASARADTLVVAGEQQLLTVIHGATSVVHTVPFELRWRNETNWALQHNYSQANSSETIAVVDNKPYLLTTTLINDAVEGLRLRSVHDQLESAIEFPRIVLAAFSPQGWTTNVPPPFLSPRHPALESYAVRVKRSSMSPFLPSEIDYLLDDRKVETIDDDAVARYFGPARLGRRKFREFLKSQEQHPAHYIVEAWTNFSGLQLPVRARLDHWYDEEGQSFPRIHRLTVTNLSQVADLDLRPALTTNGSVTYVVDGGVYIYPTTSARQWLDLKEAKELGRFIRWNPSPHRREPELGLVSYSMLIIVLLAPIGWIAFRTLRAKSR